MDKIAEAFLHVDRADFLPNDVQGEAVFDVPVPIGFGQTNSQPTTVKLMLEWLQPALSHTVLDVGSGSGWTTALLAYIVGPKGKIFAVEKVPELVKYGQENCRRAGIMNARFYAAGETLGLPEHAPYDRILVSTSAPTLPQTLIDQLRPGGRMVVPVQGNVLEVSKLTNGELAINPHAGFLFVPLVDAEE